MSNFYHSPYVIKTADLLHTYGKYGVDPDSFQDAYGDEIAIKWSEQGFMLIKCLVFMEEESSRHRTWNTQLLNKLLTAKTPKEAKECGRAVRGYNERTWNSLREEAMYFNLIRKFGQNPGLKAQLLATDDDILVEASPYDKIWGVGLRETDPRINDPSQWGKNFLGKCLGRVRDALRVGIGH